MEEAQDDGDRRKEHFPGELSGRPAVGIDGLRTIIRVEKLGFLLEIPIGFGQLGFIGGKR